MIQHSIAFLFGINTITPIKVIWIAITIANVILMLWLAWYQLRGVFGLYLWSSAFCVMLQGSTEWARDLEIWWALITAAWVWTLLPKHSYGRIFALSIGIIVTFTLILAVPPPWKGYPPELYYTRLFSTAAFLGVAFGSALMTRNPSTMLAVPWFMAVLLASSQRGLDRWVVGIITNLMWSGCLICWLAISRRKDGNLRTKQEVEISQSLR